jgi:hypothetical protein
MSQQAQQESMQSGLAAAMAVRGTGAPTMTWARLIGQHKAGLGSLRSPGSDVEGWIRTPSGTLSTGQSWLGDRTGV